MPLDMTPAARRALETARQCFDTTVAGDTTARAILLALVSEPESRAAAVLARHGVDLESVRRRWPELADRSAHERGTIPPPWGGSEILSLLESVPAISPSGSLPEELTTEHLLLALLLSDDETAAWLRGQGVDDEEIVAELRCWSGRDAAADPDLPDRPPAPEPPSGSPGGADAPRPDEPAARGEAGGPTCRVRATGGPRAGEAAQTADSRDQEHDCRGGQAPEQYAVTRERRGFDQTAGVEESVEAGVGEVVGSRTGRVRVLDAAANRASEALRTIEDFARFVLDDQHLTAVCKQLRHELVDALRPIPTDQRLAARETLRDVGVSLTTPGERSRVSADDLVEAAFARLQQALRSLEEFGKLEDPSIAAAIKQIRYRSYTMHRALGMVGRSLERLSRSRLYVLLDGRQSPEEFEAMARSIVAAGTSIVQLRDKTLPDGELLDRARRLRSVCDTTPTPDGRPAICIINDRPDLAVLSRADGVHLGQDDLPLKAARSIVGPERLVGVSTHSIQQARQAVLDGADYIGCGPTFPSGTKHFGEFPGLDFLRQVAAEIRLPAFAIGGITPENIAQVLATGMNRVAVAGAVVEAPDPAAAVRTMANHLL